MTATCSRAGIQGLAQKGRAIEFRNSVASLAQSLGGEMVHFYFVLGGWTLFMVFDVPRSTVARLVYLLSMDERVNPDSVKLNRVSCDIKALDAEFAAGSGAWRWI
jgi:uncharacterized protein with GYD domain